MIPFSNVPNDVRVPLFYAEVDNSQANTATAIQRTLIIGQMTDLGIASPDIPQICGGVGDAQAKYGINSQLAAMFAAYRKNDDFGEVWCLPLADPDDAPQASTTITITGTPEKNGVISLYVGAGGYWANGTGLYQIPVSTVSTVASIAAAIANTINSDVKAPVSAEVSPTNVITLTAVHAGETGNEIDVRLNYLDTLGGQATPLGLTIVIASQNLEGGVSNPSLNDALANLGDTTFDFIVCPYKDTASLDALDGFLNERWSWSQQLYGGYFAVNSGTFGDQTTLGSSRNNPHGSILGVYDSPTPSWLIAAQYTGAIVQSLKNDPGRPLQTLPIVGMFAPKAENRFELTERNALLYNGISTFTVGDDGTCRIEAIITTYQTNAFGSPDNSFLKIETMYLLAYILRFMKTRITSKYGRVKLAANGTRFAQGAAIVTPNIIRADVIAAYQELEFNGYVQDADAFAKGLIVEQNAQNKNRVDVLWPGTLINQLNIFALLAQFKL
ncbi:phage tail sheath subtilisin-like domain-containing protein [Acinetobacter sp. Ac_5812]|uniref:phage tail sheath subtilisin-like domain-containing protein n=1 Tax=Acinetobacter sp. Ac_5812 TaxID=1848937 RepID=UPI00148FBF25|nr:phage tail sheath subtilisin-like domain-containing protein [Acinetobacter sp. Ac_5812]NNP68961.1 phage tail protein [Acinetobacter sp. Ac_5812]